MSDIAVPGPRVGLVQAVEDQRLRVGLLDQPMQFGLAVAVAQDQASAALGDVGRKRAERLVEPPLGCGADRTPLQMRIADVDRHDGPAAGSSRLQRRIVPEPQVAAKPHQDRACGHAGVRVHAIAVGDVSRHLIAAGLRYMSPVSTPERTESPAVSQPNAVITLSEGVQRPVVIGGGARIAFIAGPCQMESRQHALETAHALKEIGERLDVSIIYKTSFDKANRTSATAARGIGLADALPIFAEIKAVTGLPTLTDVHSEAQCAPVAEAVDVLQIPAFLSRQTDLLLAAAATGRAINIKKGQFLAPWDMKNVIAKVVGAGNPNVMACERGASFGYNTLVSDMRALPVLRDIGCPVVFDATHSVQQPGGQGTSSGGQREFVPVLARAAVSVGVDAVFIETHPDPDHAPSDGPNMVPLGQFEALARQLIAFDDLAREVGAKAPQRRAA